MKPFLPPDRNLTRKLRKRIIFLERKFDSKRERKREGKGKEPADRVQSERERESRKVRKKIKQSYHDKNKFNTYLIKKT